MSYSAARCERIVGSEDNSVVCVFESTMDYSAIEHDAYPRGSLLVLVRILPSSDFGAHARRRAWIPPHEAERSAQQA